MSIYEACRDGNIDAVNILLDNEKFYTKNDSQGANDWNRGLYFAFHNNYFEIIQLLVAKGADEH